jgi:Protein of unknown function (DUF3072)
MRNENGHPVIFPCLRLSRACDKLYVEYAGEYTQHAWVAFDLEQEVHVMKKNKRDQDNPEQSNTRKDPDEWTTGDEPMTGAQRSYLKTLSDEAGEPMDENLTKAEASKRIDALQRKTGRGLNKNPR